MFGLALLMATALAGCTDPPAQESSEPETRKVRTSRGGSTLALGMADFGDADQLWGERTEIKAIDQRVQWHDVVAGGQGDAYNLASQFVANPCLWQPQEVYFNNRAVHFDDPAQLVINGTGSIRMRLDWSVTDFPFDELSYAYRTPDGNFTQGPMVQKGRPHEFQLHWGDWDLVGSGRTGWAFYICISDEDPDGIYFGRGFVGSFHLRMDLVRGPVLPPRDAPK